MTFGQALESSTFGVLGAFGKPSVSYFWSSGNFLPEFGILQPTFWGLLETFQKFNFWTFGNFGVISGSVGSTFRLLEALGILYFWANF